MDNNAAERPDLVRGEPRSLDRARLGSILTDRKIDPPVKGLMIWGTNPAVSQLDGEAVSRGLARDDLFTVVLEQFMTDTARHADIVLPSTTQLEHFDLQGAWGHHYIAINHPAIAPLGEAKPHAEVMRLLAARLDLDHPALREQDEEIAASALPAGIDLDDLMARGWLKASPPRPDPAAHGSVLPIASGLAAPGALHVPVASHEGELRLLTPKSHYFLNSTFANMSRQRAKQGRPLLQMSAADAQVRGLADGEAVLVENDRGTVPAVLSVSDNIKRGVAALDGKWWNSPPETAAVTNRLVAGLWSEGGQPAYNDLFVSVRTAPAEAAE